LSGRTKAKTNVRTKRRGGSVVDFSHSQALLKNQLSLEPFQVTQLSQRDLYLQGGLVDMALLGAVLQKRWEERHGQKAPRSCSA